MQVINTKLSIPPLRTRLVDRPRLIHKLNQGVACGFVLVSAAAGYGKSTLLSNWVSQWKFPSAWLSLDDGDNHPVRFLTYLISALRKIDAAVGEDLEAMLRASPLPDVETLLTPLVNELAKVERPFCLVLDDYHLIQDQTVHQLVRFLLEHRPAPLHLVISTRADPPPTPIKVTGALRDARAAPARPVFLPTGSCRFSGPHHGVADFYR